MARALTITESNEERDGVGDDGCTIEFLQEDRASTIDSRWSLDFDLVARCGALGQVPFGRCTLPKPDTRLLFD